MNSQLTLLFILLLLFSAFAQVDENGAPLNMLSTAEELAGWTLLWDGKTLNGWLTSRLEPVTGKGWAVHNGVLTVNPSRGLSFPRGGDIVTVTTYDAFELSLEFNITTGANSGIKYFVYPELLKEKGTALGLEYQILDDVNHPDAKNGMNANRTVASLYDLIPPENKTFNPPGEWNHARIIAKKNGDVEHWLNGKKVVEYNRFSQIYRTLLVYSKYKDYEMFGQIPKGHILLQEHGDTVSFRNIKIRELE